MTMSALRVTVAAFLTVVLVAAPAAAQTTTGSTSTSTSETTGSYDRLSTGNRKIARALFEAQKTEPGTGTTNLTLDEIAAMKQSGQGWGQVFKEMQARGLVTDKNLGQAVSKYNHQQHASRGETTTAGNRVTDSHGGGTGRNGDHDKSGHGVGHDRTGNSGHGGSSANSGYGSVGSGHGSSSGHGGGHGKSK